ncbi:MAG: sterol desaturase family protein, partial [Bacteroidetes bacterium]|nr:sterol desaturase family protein [Bacteroidota bacterium]
LVHSLLFFIGGMFFWTFLEYLLHRYLFHFTGETQTAQRIHYVLHGVHHHFPRNKNKLFMPPLPGLVLIGILYFIFKFIIGGYVFAFLPGLVTGYLFYVFLHYLIHTIKPPKFLEHVWTHHFMHHHRHSEKCFGVSTKIWDRVFGTMPPKKKNKNSVH